MEKQMEYEQLNDQNCSALEDQIYRTNGPVNRAYAKLNSPLGYISNNIQDTNRKHQMFDSEISILQDEEQEIQERINRQSNGNTPFTVLRRASTVSSLVSADIVSTSPYLSGSHRIWPNNENLLKSFSNKFNDQRHEESYQLHTSDREFTIARRLFLCLLVFEVAIEAVFIWYSIVCADKNGEHDVTKEMREYMCRSYGIGEARRTYVPLAFIYLPFAALYAFLPLKYIQGGMKLRIGIYFIRRRWKTIAQVIIAIYFVGKMSTLNAILFYQDSIPTPENKMATNSIITTSCIDAYELEKLMLGSYGPFAVSLSLAAIILAIVTSNVFLIVLKLDFPHVVGHIVLINVISIFFGIWRIIRTPAIRIIDMVIVYFVSVILPSIFTLLSTYAEDRAARTTYASHGQAMRQNTALKLDLTLKRAGLANNQSVTKDERLAMENALKGQNSQLLQSVSIPFDDLELRELIAKTPNCEVLLADYHGTSVVLKRLPFSSLSKDALLDFKLNVEVLASLRHPNIVLFIGATFNNLSNVGMVLEYLERGDVLTLLRSSMQLSWSDPLLKIATDVAQGGSFLHNCDPPIIHRDLKSSNLLCTTTYSCKISDFDQCKRQSIDGLLASTIVGTPYWLAPEVLKEEKFGVKVDCYSFGIVLMELETRRDPYADVVQNTDCSVIDVMMRIASGNLRPTIPPSLQGAKSTHRRELIERCLHMDPNQRPDMTEILSILQNSVRQELLLESGNAPFDITRDKRRVKLMQRHQKLNRKGVKDLLQMEE